MKILLKRIIQLSPLLMIGVMAILYFTTFRSMTLEQILNYTPEEPAAAAAVILLMYALKSLSFFFPMFLIAAAAGAIFPIYIAIPLNLAGIVIMATIPYLIGRYAESEAVDRLAEKHKKIGIIKEYSSGRHFAGAFFLRIISCLPYDIVSLAMGSLRFDYKKYLLGTFLGTAPGFILTTIMGSAITEPLSPEFIICALVEMIIAIISAVIYKIHRSRKKA
ncbi:MAG: VTT domain-containing protein [Oscillospiraceae bacterium]|nr:VTT domain-containing protein [Oscillospiraceae bacterium]